MHALKITYVEPIDKAEHCFIANTWMERAQEVSGDNEL